MSRRADSVGTLTCDLTEDEKAVIASLKFAVSGDMGHARLSDANLARVAFWSLADHVGIAMPPGVFDLRLDTGRYNRVTNPKIKMDASWPRPKGRKQGRTHPWNPTPEAPVSEPVQP